MTTIPTSAADARGKQPKSGLQDGFCFTLKIKHGRASDLPLQLNEIYALLAEMVIGAHADGTAPASSEFLDRVRHDLWDLKEFMDKLVRDAYADEGSSGLCYRVDMGLFRHGRRFNFTLGNNCAGREGMPCLRRGTLPAGAPAKDIAWRRPRLASPRCRNGGGSTAIRI